MLETLKAKIITLTRRDDPRSQAAIYNILMSLGVKGGGIVVNLLLVSSTISYINTIQYGIWLTISSIVGWMTFFDIGLGNGLRNKLAIAMAEENREDARILVSTTYASLAAIGLMLFLFFFVVNPLIDWDKFLNIPKNAVGDITYIMMIVSTSFCVQFIVQVLNTVLTAIHKPAIAALIAFIGQLGILIAINILKHFVEGDLQTLVWALTFIPILVLIISSIYLYSSSLRFLAPSINKIRIKYVKSIMNTGGTFFIIQIGAMLLFQTNNIIITKILGPTFVTEFNVMFKLFSVITMVFTIVITPYWSAFTDAYIKKDFSWMKNTLRLIRTTWLGLSVGSIVLLMVSKTALHLWIGDKAPFSWSLASTMAIYTVVFMWQAMHVYILNGLNKVRLQLILVIIGALTNIPFGIYLGKIYGLPGIICSNTIVFLVIGLTCSVQVEKILNGTANGLWSK